MIKPLLTRNCRVGALLGFFILLFSSSMIAQTLDDSAPCICQADETYFQQDLVINSGNGENWIVSSSGNFFESVAPDTEFPNTTLITEDPVGSGMYPFSGFYTAGTPFTITLTNGVDEIEYTLTDPCVYTEVEGDSYVCDTQGPVTYSLTTAVTGAITWSVNPAPMASVPSGNTLLVEWGSVTGDYTVTATGTSAFGCPFEIDYPVIVADATDADQIACNNLVNISLNGTCELELFPDMILEAPGLPNDAYSIIIQDTETGEILTNNMVTQDYVGVLLQVSVIQDCSGNSCWGQIFVEDKSAPFLECPEEVTLSCEDSSDPEESGFPVFPVGTNVIPQGDGSYIIEDYDFCGDAFLSFEDSFSDTHLCDGPFGAIIEREWLVVDEAGNTNSCTQIINIERATLDAFLSFPADFDDAIAGANPSLEACGDWEMLPNGYPSPEHTGYPDGTFCANVLVEYEDTELEKCGDQSYKLIRKWKIRDICELIDTTHNQFIVVTDDQAPVFTTLPDDITVEAASHTCVSDIVVPQPLFVEECSEWSYTVGYKVTDDSADPFTDFITDGVEYNFITQQYTIKEIPAAGDMVWIIYILEDACGNTSTGNIEVSIVDNEPPIPVCDQFTFVGLDEFGEAHAGYESFDDGSWDNCSVHAFEVIRMDGNPCGGPLAWGEKVYFCCEDVGNTVQVRLRVWDTSGNNNECMVNVEVQDNTPPALISCPPSRTLNCDADLSDLSVYGMPVFSDVCGFTLTEDDPIIDNEECGSGSTVIRRFTATDDAGNSTSCTQILTLQITDPFSYSDIDWPDDIEFEGCTGLDVLPDNLPLASGFPRYSNVACSQVSESFDDKVFENTEGVCYKILRSWTVHDHCTDSFWERVQVIKVVNFEAPNIFTGCDEFVVTDLDPADCEANVSVTIQASDDCTPDADLVYFYIIDNDPNQVGYSNSVNGTFSLGTHSIRWTVSDECGNATTCTTEIDIEDNKPPTPICRDAIVTTINEDGGTVDIWATDFIKEGNDNCDDQLDLHYSFSSNINDVVQTFTCDDIEDGSSDTIELQIYVTDVNGNQDFCSTMLILQDNNGVCNGVNLANVDIEGRVYTENNDQLEDVEIMLMSNAPEFPAYEMTNGQGAFAFRDLDAYTDYTIEATMEDSYLNGVSTLDILLIQKHILGLQILDSPYKVIAADVNSSDKVTAVDIVELRKLILGIYTELPSSTSWKFVDQSENYPDPTQPFPFSELIDYYNVNQNMMQSDFIAVKMGDVNQTVSFNSDLEVESRTAGTIQLNLEATDENRIAVTAEEDMTLAGFQFSVLNTDQFEFTRLESAVIDVQGSNYTVDNNRMNLSWNVQDAVQVQAGEVLFYIETATALKENTQIVLDNTALRAELYVQSEKIEIYNLELRNTEVLNAFSLYQNVPNPFNTTTTVSFNLPSDSEAKITVTDVTGKLLYTITDEFEKGYNAMQINIDQIHSSGLLYLTLETKTHTATNKMIMIK